MQIILDSVQMESRWNHPHFNQTAGSTTTSQAQRGQMNSKQSSAAVRGILLLMMMMATGSCIFWFLVVLAGKCGNQESNGATNVNQTHWGERIQVLSPGKEKKNNPWDFQTLGIKGIWCQSLRGLKWLVRLKNPVKTRPPLCAVAIWTYEAVSRSPL